MSGIFRLVFVFLVGFGGLTGQTAFAQSTTADELLSLLNNAKEILGKRLLTEQETCQLGIFVY